MAKTYYNGVLLPEIPSEYVSECPYHIIAKRYQEDGTSSYIYVLSNIKAKKDNSLESVIIEYNSTNTVYIFTLMDDGTLKRSVILSSLNLNLVNSEYPYHEFIWCDYDIKDSNGDIYFEGEVTYKIRESKLARFGDEIRRMSGKTEPMETNEMLEFLSNIHSAEGVGF